MDAKRKIEESLAILNSLFTQPNKRIHSETPSESATSGAGETVSWTGSNPPVLPVKKQRVYLPPRPAVLDKLSRLAASRPTLKDSIAASIAASAPATHRSNSSNTGTHNDDPSSSSLTNTAAVPGTTGTKRFAPMPSLKKKYMPWSREQFHERLETFKPSTWFDKPKLVNAVECAKRGWINTADDRLDCWGGCGGVVIVRVDQDMDRDSSSQGAPDEGDMNAENNEGNIQEIIDVDDLVHGLDIEGK
jgi:hypothetical protein